MVTENEAIKILKKPTEHIKIYDDDFVFSSDFAKAYETAIKALEEIQAYRAIGTPTQILEKIGGLCVELGKYACIGTVEELRNLQDQYWKLNEICKEYSSIGTVEEFKALKKKSVAKKADGIEIEYRF